MCEVVITGIGAISAIGNNVNEIYTSLKHKTHGIAKPSILESNLSNEFPAGEVKLDNKELQHFSGLTGIHSRTTLLAAVAVSEALNNAQLYDDLINQTGLISSTTVGGMDITEKIYKHIAPDQSSPLIKVHPGGNHSSELANFFGLQNHVSTISTACSSASNALIFGARLIKSSILERVVVGGVDSLSKFTMNGFKSLMILDEDHCKPFDKNRKGLNLGEAAGYLVLENKSSAEKRGAKILGIVSGYANVNEAYHQTASTPKGEGAFSAMALALKNANMTVEQIDYINTHGTGTLNNDASESTAINRLFRNTSIVFSSTKVYTGHTLAAAGGLEAVISVLCLENNHIPEQINFFNAIEGEKLTPFLGKSIKRNILHVMSNSFGFGGNNTSIIFSKKTHKA